MNAMFVCGKYLLQGEADAEFSLNHIWKLFQEDSLPNNANNFCREMINCMKGGIIYKNIKSSTEH